MIYNGRDVNVVCVCYWTFFIYFICICYKTCYKTRKALMQEYFVLCFIALFTRKIIATICQPVRTMKVGIQMREQRFEFHLPRLFYIFFV
ncbi:hypothetical protein F5X99DRAFT_352432 [Biscogniauxia marginata]|nr:hypothetical protein F5X99DRAFT_352432 [Biscogniauxia marginata]